jgi:hypothetical protein
MIFFHYIPQIEGKMKKIYQYLRKSDGNITHAVYVVEKTINYQIYTNLVGQLENFLKPT